MATNQTTNYQLNQWEPTDPVLRTDFNADNAKIETALASLEARVSVLSRVVRDLAYYMEQVGILSILKHDEHLSQWSMVCDAFQKSSRYEVTGQAVIQNGVLTVDGTGTVTSMNFGLGRSSWTKAQLWVLSSGTGTINVTLNGKAMEIGTSWLSTAPDGEVGADQQYTWDGTGQSSAQIKLEIDSGSYGPLKVYHFRLFCF